MSGVKKAAAYNWLKVVKLPVADIVWQGWTGRVRIVSSVFSSLFPDVVNCMQTDNLELKKLVYLYLMNYAKSQPDMAIMAVNTFVKVSYFWFPIKCFVGETVAVILTIAIVLQ